MIHRIQSLVRSGFTRLVDEAEKRARMKGFWALVLLVIVAILFFVWNQGTASRLTVTHDQARTYAGVLAQVIPVLLLALYVESTTEWSRTQAVQREERLGFLKLGRGIESAREKAAEARRLHLEDGSTSSDLDLAESLNNDTVAGLKSMMLDHKTSSDSEGARAVSTVLQLFFGLLGELLALLCVMAPSSQLMGAATMAMLFVLFLFGQRLVEWPRSVSDGRAVRLLSYVMGPVLLLAYVAAAARTIGITVTG